MIAFRRLASIWAIFLAALIAPTVNAATYAITFYEGIGDTTNIFTGHVVVGSGTFSIADSAVIPNNLVMFSDPEFLSFEASLSVTTGDSSTFTLGIDDFREGTDRERGILFDASGNPFRFDLPGLTVSDSRTMCEPTCSVAVGARARLTLVDDNNFEKVFLDDGSIELLSALIPGTPYTPLAGVWSYHKGTSYDGGSGVTVDGYYQISAVPIPPAILLFGSGLIGLIGVTRRRKVA
jgi:hypothetical protein